MFNILANDTNSIGIVHSFIEKVAKKLNYILMSLSFEKLNGFFFVFIELVQTLSLNFF